MWNPRLYALICCVGLLGRWSYRAALRQLDGEFGGLAGLITFWIPLVGIICIGASMLAPMLMRQMARLRNRG